MKRKHHDQLFGFMLIVVLVFFGGMRGAFGDIWQYWGNEWTVGGVTWHLGTPFADWDIATDDYPPYTYLREVTWKDASTVSNLAIPSCVRWLSHGSRPDGDVALTGIRSEAFRNCSSIYEVSLPSSITNVMVPAFRGCKNLRSIQYLVVLENTSPSTLHPYWSTNGVLYRNNALVKYPEGKDGNYFEVPVAVTALQDGCLAGTKLAAVRFLGNKPACGDGVFTGSALDGYCPESWGMSWGQNWNGIKMHPIPESGIWVEDGVTNCCELTDGVLWRASLEDGQATLRGVAGAKGAMTVPDTLGGCPVTAIEDLGGTHITSVTIPVGVTNINLWATDSTSLAAIIVAAGNPVYAAADGVLFSKDMKTLLRCPEGKSGAYAIPPGVESIGLGAFSVCGGLESVFIPTSVVSIAPVAFSESSLVSIEVDPGNPVYAAQDGAVFSKDMKTLLFLAVERADERYAVPEGVEEIAECAFMRAGLKAVTFPESLRSIGVGAFEMCNLAEVTIPAGVTFVGPGAFWSNWGLDAIKVDSVNPAYVSVDGVLFTKDMKKLVAFPAGKAAENYVVPAGVAEICDLAFGVCENVSTVLLPESLLRIGERAFSYNWGLATLTIPGHVESVGAGAFEGCEALATLRVPISWEGTEMLANAGVPSGCTIIYYDPPPREETEKTPIPVPFSWLVETASSILAHYTNDYESAAAAPAANGRPVWECYVADISPADATDFKTTLAFENGQWLPKPVPDRSSTRIYDIEGTDRLAPDAVWGPTNSSTRFFRLRVRLP